MHIRKQRCGNSEGDSSENENFLLSNPWMSNAVTDFICIFGSQVYYKGLEWFEDDAEKMSCIKVLWERSQSRLH